MNLYLDEDSTDPTLLRILNDAAHDVVVPRDVSMLGESDPAQLAYAIREHRVLVTHNYDDFRDLHNLICHAGGRHPGILVIRRENNPRRDLSPRGIALCITRFAASEVAIESQLVVLNQWR